MQCEVYKTSFKGIEFLPQPQIYLCNQWVLTFDISNLDYWPNRINSLKYLRFTTLGCQDTGTRIFKFVAKTQFLYFQAIAMIKGFAFSNITYTWNFTNVVFIFHHFMGPTACQNRFIQEGFLNILYVNSK